MLISSALCYAQEAHHQKRAADTALANVRSIAIGAATAWRLEGVAAEKREARQLRTREFASNALAEQGREAELLLLSENPDRGFASA